MDQETKKTDPIAAPAPLDDAELNDVSGGAVSLDSSDPACPDCGGNLYPQQDEHYCYLVCRACGYKKKTGQHS